ncbi:MAG: TenA family protein, partial [Terriglobia bacterium]
LCSFARAYALAAARSPDAETLHAFRELLDGAAQELQLHARYSETLGIDLARVTPYAATRAYTDFLLATAWHAPLEETVAAMTPCMRLYAFLGQDLAGQFSAAPRETHPYRDWIETYSGAEFQAAAARLEALLDRLATDCAAIRGAYRYALECELRFFSAPLEGAP